MTDDRGRLVDQWPTDTRVVIARAPTVLAEHVVADRLTGRTGTVLGPTPDRQWVVVKVDGLEHARTIHPEHLQHATGADPE